MFGRQKMVLLKDLVWNFSIGVGFGFQDTGSVGF